MGLSKKSAVSNLSASRRTRGHFNLKASHWHHAKGSFFRKKSRSDDILVEKTIRENRKSRSDDIIKTEYVTKLILLAPLDKMSCIQHFNFSVSLFLPNCRPYRTFLTNNHFLA